MVTLWVPPVTVDESEHDKVNALVPELGLYNTNALVVSTIDTTGGSTVPEFFAKSICPSFVMDIKKMIDEEDVSKYILKSFKHGFRELYGEVYNFLPNEEELAMQKKAADAEKAAEAKAIEDAEKSKVLSEEEEKLLKRKEEELKKFDKAKREENTQLEQLSEPLRDYMQSHVVPTVTEALIEICKVMPDDPVDYMAEYLFSRSEEMPFTGPTN